MLKSKIVVFSLYLSFATAMAFDSVNESVTDIYHPPAAKSLIVMNSIGIPEALPKDSNPQLTEKLPISEIKDNQQVEVSANATLQNDISVPNKDSSESHSKIKDFITKLTNFDVTQSISTHAKEFYTFTTNLGNSDNKYAYLNTQETTLKNDWLSSEELLSDYNNKVKKLKKMKKLASYISEQYNVPLPSAEKIVYSTFVEANKKNLDPNLVLSLIDVESTFQQFSKSRAGAVGLTQVMAHVHKQKIGELHKEHMNIWSIPGNIKVGTQILREYVDLAGGNLKKALQMYNGSAHDDSYKYSNKIMSRMQTFNTVVAAL
jgi:hypothetical protein